MLVETIDERCERIKEFAISPSLGALIYQTRVLIRELKSINDEEYPLETCLIRDVFLCLAEHISELLEKDFFDPATFTGIKKDIYLGPVYVLGRAIHNLHFYSQFLWTSSPLESPPPIQAILTQLTELYFPKGRGKPTCIVRPQWEHNLQYYPLTPKLTWIAPIEILGRGLEVFLFSVDAKYQDALDKNVLSDDLRKKFQAEGFELSKNVTVDEVGQDGKWMITQSLQLDNS